MWHRGLTSNLWPIGKTWGEASTLPRTERDDRQLLTPYVPPVTKWIKQEVHVHVISLVYLDMRYAEWYTTDQTGYMSCKQ